MKRRAVIAGASGFVGTALATAFEDEGYAVVRVGRTGPDATWDDPSSLRRSVDGAQIVVNLAGKSVNCRYTEGNRREILESRVSTTRALRVAVAEASAPPAVWFNASTATIYRHAMDQPQTEGDGELGRGFSVDVARAWESEFFSGELPRTRRVALRMAIVLGDGPATALLVRLARLGLGGPQYDGPWFAHRRYRGIGENPTQPDDAGWHRTRGRQRFSWIHLDDVISAVRFLRDHTDLEGPVNLAAPGTVDNRTLMASLRRSVGMPLGLPAPRAALEPAMWMLRTEPELVLKSRWVAPGVLSAAGFRFRYPDLDPALRDVTSAGR